MKKINLVFIILLLPALASAQLKKQSEPLDLKQELLRPLNENNIGLGLIDFSKLSMSHSVSMSYFSMGGQSLSQSMYLNTMNYQVSDPLSVQLQWGVRNFPHNTFGNNAPALQNGFFISGAEINYKPSDKFQMKLQYSSQPSRYYYNNYSNPLFRHQSNLFQADDEE